MITPLYQFGAYTYPKCVIQSLPHGLDITERRAETPGSAGDYTQGGLRAARNLKFTGTLIADTGDEIEDLWDDFLAAHEPGAPKQLFYGRDDRYYNAEVVGIQEVRPGELIAARGFEVSFRAADPFEYSATSSGTVTLGTGATVTNAGKQPCRTLIYLYLSTGGGLVTITNTTTGKVCTIAPGTNLTPILEGDRERVTNGSSVDITRVFAGQWIELAPGANTLTVVVSGGAVLTTSTILWRARW